MLNVLDKRRSGEVKKLLLGGFSLNLGESVICEFSQGMCKTCCCLKNADKKHVEWFSLERSEMNQNELHSIIDCVGGVFS